MELGILVRRTKVSIFVIRHKCTKQDCIQIPGQRWRRCGMVLVPLIWGSQWWAAAAGTSSSGCWFGHRASRNRCRDFNYQVMTRLWPQRTRNRPNAVASLFICTYHLLTLFLYFADRFILQKHVSAFILRFFNQPDFSLCNLSRTLSPLRRRDSHHVNHTINRTSLPSILLGHSCAWQEA